MKRYIVILLTSASNVLLLISLSVQGATPANVVPPTEVAERYPGILLGYLAPEAMPDGLKLVPTVPAQHSTEAKQDELVNQQHLALLGTPRWAWAARDAGIDFPAASQIFTCALGRRIDVEAMPHLVMLLRRSLTDFGLSTSAVKKYYQRPRPFLTNEKAVCIPDEIEGLRNSGSYPSGHAAIGWGWALVLAQMLPHRADQIIARGRAFGESRAICNVHWSSDVVQGQRMAEAVFEQLREDAMFNAELSLAQQELERAVEGLPADQCREESAVLKIKY